MIPQASILIIDDEEDVANLLAKRLKANGYKVTCLYKGNGAIQAMRQAIPDLLLLDIWMPDLNGKEIFRLMREDAELNRIPVIFFSADPSQEETCLSELGADGFIRKPYNPMELTDLIRNILKKNNV